MLINLVQQLLQIVIADLVRQAGNQRLGLLRQLAAQAAQLRALELGEFRVGGEKALDGFDVLFALEAGEVVEVFEGLVEHPVEHFVLALFPLLLSPSLSSSGGDSVGVEWEGDALAVIDTLRILIHLALRDEGIDDKRRFRVRQRVHVLELAELELRAGFFVALGGRTLAHCLRGVGGHVGRGGGVQQSGWIEGLCWGPS